MGKMKDIQAQMQDGHYKYHELTDSYYKYLSIKDEHIGAMFIETDGTMTFYWEDDSPWKVPAEMIQELSLEEIEWCIIQQGMLKLILQEGDTLKQIEKEEAELLRKVEREI